MPPRHCSFQQSSWFGARVVFHQRRVCTVRTVQTALCLSESAATAVNKRFCDPLPFFHQPVPHLQAQERFQVPKMEAPGGRSLAPKRIKTEELEEISNQADQQADSSPDWLLLPENVYVQIFDYLNPGKLLSIRRVHPRWKRLAEASAETRTELLLMQCGCNKKRTCLSQILCHTHLLRKNRFYYYFSEHRLKLDGSSFGRWRNWPMFNYVKMNGLKCTSFNAKNAQLVARLFSQISDFTVSHTSISAGHLDQILSLLTNWSATLASFKFHSNYTLVNPDERVTRSRAVANAPTDAYLNSQLTRLFRQLKSLPALKNLTLHYLSGKINSTVANFAFLPRLEELHLDRTIPEANLQAACQRYLAPPVPGAPPSVLRRFTHKSVNTTELSTIEFVRFLRDTPEALPLASASIWSQQIPLPRLQHLRQFLLRSPSVDSLEIPSLPIGTSLGPLSRTLARHNVTILCIGTVGNDVGEEAEPDTELVPVPSVRGLTILLVSPDHQRIDPLLLQIGTVFPRLSSLVLIDHRTHSLDSPAGEFTPTASDLPQLSDFATTLLAAYPLATQPSKYNQAISFLHMVRQINTLLPNIIRNFAFDAHSKNLVLYPANVQ